MYMYIYLYIYTHIYTYQHCTPQQNTTARPKQPRARLHRWAPGLPAWAHLAHTAAGAISSIIQSIESIIRSIDSIIQSICVVSFIQSLGRRYWINHSINLHDSINLLFNQSFNQFTRRRRAMSVLSNLIQKIVCSSRCACRGTNHVRMSHVRMSHVTPSTRRLVCAPPAACALWRCCCTRRRPRRPPWGLKRALVWYPIHPPSFWLHHTH